MTHYYHTRAKIICNDALLPYKSEANLLMHLTGDTDSKTDMTVKTSHTTLGYDPGMTAVGLQKSPR